MMGFGSVGSGAGGGNSSSSFSNLSPLAPPFTVDRPNPKPNANAYLQFYESPFTSEPFHHNWEFARPSAPASELVVDSTRMTSFPLSDDYQFSAPMPISHWSAVSPGGMASGNEFGYDGAVKGYYSPYYDGDLVSTSGFTVSCETDHIQSLRGLKYEPGRVDSSGFNNGKWTKRVELDEGYSYEKANAGGLLTYNNQLSRGGSGIEFTSKSKQDNDVSNDKFNQVSNSKAHSGSITVGCLKDKLCIPASSSAYPPHNTFSDYQKPCSTYENCIFSVDSVSAGSVSVIRPSTKVIIRAAPAVNGPSIQTIVSPKPSRSGNVTWAQSGNFDHFSNSAQKNPGLNLSSEIKQGNGQVFVSSSSVKELSTPSEDSFADSTTAIFGSQLPNIKVSGGFNRVQVEEFSDLIDDQQHSVEDSPCWKRPPSLEVSSLDVQTGSSKRDFNVFFGIDLDEHHNFYPAFGSMGTSSEIACEGNKNIDKECETNGVILTLEKTLDCQSRPVSSTDDAKCRVRVSSRDEVGLTNNLESTEQVSEGGEIAVHVAEKVLDSPFSREEATELTEQCPVPKFDVPTVVNAMHNLSELLLSHLSNDACTLEEENVKTLNQIQINLDSCTNKKTIQAMSERDPSNPAGDVSKKCEGTIQAVLVRQMKMGESLGDDFNVTRDDSITEAIRKVLEENFDFNEEMHSQAPLFKNLWLEAEAKLCSISYKARYNRMKIGMEKSEPKAPREMVSKVHTMPDPCTASKPIPKPNDDQIPELPVQKSAGAVAIEASIMDGFKILKLREDNPKPINLEHEKQAEMVDDEFAENNCLAKCSRDQSSDDILELAKRPQTGSPNEERNDLRGHDFQKEVHLFVQNDPMEYSLANSNINDQHYSGWHTSSYSGWEHVLNPGKFSGFS